MSDGASLLKAVENGDLEQVRSCLESGVDPNAADAHGAIPLHWAAFRGQAEICELLLEHGAEANARARDGRTPLHLAAQGGSTEVLDLLLAYQADISAPDHSELRTPLHLAAQEGQFEAASHLISCGMPVDERDAAGRTPLWLAARHGQLETVQTLLALGADIDAPDNDGVTPLLSSLIEEYSEIARGLLGMGARANVQDLQEGLTPLHAAAANGDPEIVRLLLESGAALDLGMKDGATAEEVARAAGHCAVVEELQRFASEHGLSCGEGGRPTSSKIRQIDLPDEDDEPEAAPQEPPSLAAPDSEDSISDGGEKSPASDEEEDWRSSSAGDEPADPDGEAESSEAAGEFAPSARWRKAVVRLSAALAVLVLGTIVFSAGVPRGADGPADGGFLELPEAERVWAALQTWIDELGLPTAREPGRSEPRAVDRPAAAARRQPPQRRAAPTQRSPQFFSFKGPVNDFASVLDGAAIRYLEDLIGALDARTGIDFIVVTVSSTAPLSVEEYAKQLVERWRPAVTDSAVLLVVAVADHQSAVFTPGGVGGALWKLRRGEILSEVVTPRLRRGEPILAVEEGTRAMTKLLALESNLTTARAGARSRSKPSSRSTTVTIASRPPGAAVSIDGEETGTTPFVAVLEPGQYSVQLTKPGYRDRTEKIVVTGNVTKHRFDLEPLPR